MIELSQKDLLIVKKILSAHVATYRVWAFGSRVNGKTKKHSDLDLVIITEKPIPTLTLALLKEDFSESDLPIKVDILDWATLDENFKKIILQKHEVIT